MTQDANSILMGSGAPAAKFEQVGTTVTGTVAAEPEARQQTNFRTGLPETWKDGSPRMQILVRLATNLRDPQRADDDGERTLFIKGKYLTDAIRQAVRASGAKGIHVGGTLTVTYTGDGPIEPGLEKGPKLYAAQYEPPAVSLSGVSEPAAQTQQPAPATQQPAPATQQPAPAAQVPPAPPGVDPKMWDRMDAEQRKRVIAAMAPAGETVPF